MFQGILAAIAGAMIVSGCGAQFASRQGQDESTIGSVDEVGITISSSLPDTDSEEVANTPPPASTGDGSNAAQACSPQRPSLLAGYVKRPSWRVAGVDYCVGYASNLVLKNPAAIAMAGVAVDSTRRLIRITGPSITLDGYDFSGWYIQSESSNARIVNSKFLSAGSGNPIIGMQSSTNLYVGYSIIDGNNKETGGLVEMRGKGNVVVEYNWLKNSGSDILQMHVNGATDLTVRYNLIENAGMTSGAHGDYTEFIGGPFTTKIMFNTTLQSGGTTQGFMVEPDLGSNAGVIVAGEIGNNTFINKGGLSYFVGVTVPDIVNTFNVHDNFYDAAAGYGFAVGGSRGGPGDSSAKTSYTNNVNMVNGQVSAGP